MDEILRNLRPGARVLDLGSLTGSFPLDRCPGVSVARIDLEAPAPGTCEGFVQADAARLPFPDGCFDAVIANHSLEHVVNLDDTLKEIGRVVRAEGSMYVAVPDASTVSDRLFRWAYDGGGHVNPFCSAQELANRLGQATGLELVAVRDLYSSFEYLNRYYFPRGAPWGLRILGNGSRGSIMVLSYITRVIDRVFGTRASAYGWAFYFGNVGEQVHTESWSNVCIGCGSGASAAWLMAMGHVRRRFVFRSYRCPACNARNLFTLDRSVV
jgi:SAM-dependent methyltransferase